MATVSPPKPWEKDRRVTVTGVSIPNPRTTINSPTTPLPALPKRPASLNTTVNRNASAYSPYGTNRLGVGPSYAARPPTYNNPYSRIGGVGYGNMNGVYGMGGLGAMGYGSMNNMYSGMGGMTGDPNDPNSLTNGLAQNTQATFQMIENIVGAFGGFAQMLESTYMATHSSFFAMVSVAEQFGNLKNTLGSILGIFTLLRWLRTLLAKLTGQPPPADAISLTPNAYARFQGRKFHPDGTPINPARLSKKPFLFFIAAAFGLPYLMGKLIKTMAASQEEQQRRLTASRHMQIGPNGQLIPQPIDPSKLDFCRLLYDFTPETGAAIPGVDLEVKKGDLVAVLSKSDPLGNPSEWWRCRARNGRIGYLPQVYLEVARPGQSAAKTQLVSSDTRLPKNSTGLATQNVESKSGDTDVSSLPKSPLGYK
ncbi:hypothetical protein K3495_g4054 [Podosphaera aphanis]|nr:hypothetical protein K3495_g4054 [Podosphaera aphanis]